MKKKNNNNNNLNKKYILNLYSEIYIKYNKFKKKNNYYINIIK